MKKLLTSIFIGIVLFFGFLGSKEPVFALSCRVKTPEYYIQCIEGPCEAVFIAEYKIKYTCNYLLEYTQINNDQLPANIKQYTEQELVNNEGIIKINQCITEENCNTNNLQVTQTKLTSVQELEKQLQAERNKTQESIEKSKKLNQTLEIIKHTALILWIALNLFTIYKIAKGNKKIITLLLLSVLYYFILQIVWVITSNIGVYGKTFITFETIRIIFWSMLGIEIIIFLFNKLFRK